jgi:hypothetical protein
MHLVTSAVAKPMLAGDRLQRFITGHQPPTRPVPARNGTYAPSLGRVATKVVGSGRKPPPGKAGARRTDPLGPLAARPVPHAADLQTWGVSLVAQTGW